MLVALDTETFLIYPGYMAPEMVCVSWATPSDIWNGPGDTIRSGLLHHADPKALEFVYDCFKEHDTIFANSPFDLAVFMAKWPVLTDVIFEALSAGRVHDIQTREKLLDLAEGTFRFEEDEDGEVRAKGYSLFDVSKRRLGVILDKDTWRLRYHELYDTPLDKWPAGAKHYAITDSVSALEIYLKQEPKAKYLGNEAAQVQAHMALHLISCHGFPTDPVAVAELKARVIADIDEIRDELVEAGLVRTNGSRDTKVAIRRMIEKLGAKLIWTKTGEMILQGEHDKIGIMSPRALVELAHEKGKFVSVAEEPCVMSGDPILISYSQYSKLSSLLAGPIKDFETGCITPIQPRYEVLLETGRTATSGPNIQNQRRTPGVRECFVPREGNVIVAADYGAAELHTLAQICYDLFGKSKLGDALNNGIDVHTDLAAQLLRMPYHNLLDRINDPDDEIAYNARQLAKAANFGYPGGCGIDRFIGIAHGYGLKIDERESAQTKSLWLNRWDEMEDYFRHVRSCKAGNGLYWVKQHRVERIRGKCTYTAACNSPFQGLASDGAKAAGYEITRRQFTEPSSDLYGTRILAFVHDEYLLESPEERAHEVAVELSQVMEEQFNHFVPDCKVKAEAVIMRRWSKKAKPVYNSEGRLIPWEPKAA